MCRYVEERSGLRTLTIPPRDKPGSLDAEVLADKAVAARRFLEETSKSAPDFDFEAFREHGGGLDPRQFSCDRLNPYSDKLNPVVTHSA